GRIEARAGSNLAIDRFEDSPAEESEPAADHAVARSAGDLPQEGIRGIGRPGKTEARTDVGRAFVIRRDQVIDLVRCSHVLDARTQIEREIAGHAEIVLGVEIQLRNALAGVVRSIALRESLDDSVLKVLKRGEVVGGAELIIATVVVLFAV